MCRASSGLGVGTKFDRLLSCNIGYDNTLREKVEQTWGNGLARIEISYFSYGQKLWEDRGSHGARDHLEIVNDTLIDFYKSVYIHTPPKHVLKGLADLKKNFLLLNGNRAHLILCKSLVGARYIGTDRTCKTKSELKSFIAAYASPDCEVVVYDVGAGGDLDTLGSIQK